MEGGATRETPRGVHEADGSDEDWVEMEE